jgi:hypothetical protein
MSTSSVISAPSLSLTPATHLLLSSDQILGIRYDYGDGPLQGERKIVSTKIGTYVYVKRNCQWAKVEFLPADPKR